MNKLVKHMRTISKNNKNLVETLIDIILILIEFLIVDTIVDIIKLRDLKKRLKL